MTIPSKVRHLMDLEENEEVMIFALKKEMIIRPKVEDPMKMAGFLGKEKGVKRVKDLVARYKGF
jgi:AbrB family looped-hinge helix DNA binding protein